MAVVGLRDAALIIRDRNGVPHVRTRSERDAWLGLGFVHAQDRLAQLVWLRHQARGRTAAQIGPSGLAADRWARTLDFARLAERDLARSSSAARRVLEAYSLGVNAWLAMLREGRADGPIGLTESVDAIEDWTAVDSLALAKLRAWQLASVGDEMLALEATVRRLGPASSRTFFPDFAQPRDDYRRAEGGAGATPVPRTPIAPLRFAGGLAGAHAGSSAWVVSGRFTRRGQPLLAADLHSAGS